LAMSIAQEEDRSRAQEAYLAEQAKRAAVREEAERIELEKQRLDDERALKIRQLEEETLQKRRENVAQHSASAPVTPPTEVSAAPTTAPVAPPAAPVAVQRQAPVAVPDVVRVSSSVIPPVEHGGSDLAPLGSRKAPFGSFRALPSIAMHQPTFSQLHAEAKAAAASPQLAHPASIAPAHVVINKNEPSKEQLEARAREMRELRERLMAVKKAERQVELDQYKATNISPASGGPAASDDATQLTVQIARRLREDLIGETRKQQQ
jgi:hypothetical protein